MRLLWRAAISRGTLGTRVQKHRRSSPSRARGDRACVAPMVGSGHSHSAPIPWSSSIPRPRSSLPPPLAVRRFELRLPIHPVEARRKTSLARARFRVHRPPLVVETAVEFP